MSILCVTTHKKTRSAAYRTTDRWMINMVNIPSRSPHETLKRLRILSMNRQYGFELIGVIVPNLSLEDLGEDDLRDYYLEQAEKYSFKSKGSNLQNYCYLYTYVRNKSGGCDPIYMTPEDLRYARETVAVLDALVSQKIDLIEDFLVKSDNPDNQLCPEYLGKINPRKIDEDTREIAGYVRAISTLSGTGSQ